MIRAFMDPTAQENTARWQGRRLIISAGLLLILAGLAVSLRLQPSSRSLLFWLCGASIGGGLLWSLLGAFLPKGGFLSTLRLLTGNAFVFAVMLVVAEAGFRVAGFNFNALTGQSDDPRAEYPLCFRMPEKPLGDIYFHRAGPVSWTGQPLRTLLKLKNGTDKAYEDEPSFTASYDADGFRNAEDLNDWDVVVAGDSFAESGSQPFDQIFTTQAAKLAHLRIRNLGVCNTGTLSHLQYLRSFGKSPSCKQAVLAFYDGNDIIDTEREMGELEKHRATGWWPSREAQPQRSLIKAAYQVTKGLISPSPARRYQDAWLTAGGKETPITMRGSPMPLDPETMTARQKDILTQVIHDWAETSRQQGMQPWLLYIPANNRTYHGLVRFDSNADKNARDWTPGTLPQYIRQLCESQDIRFIDACVPLRQAAEKGTLVYNPIFDTHLNAAGSRLIGELLAKHLSDAMAGAVEKPRP